MEGGFQASTPQLADAIVVAEAAFQAQRRVTGVATGFIDLDRAKLGGLHP